MAFRIEAVLSSWNSTYISYFILILWHILTAAGLTPVSMMFTTWMTVEMSLDDS